MTPEAEPDLFAPVPGVKRVYRRPVRVFVLVILGVVALAIIGLVITLAVGVVRW